MVGVNSPSPLELARVLGALPVSIERAHVTQIAVPLPDYPGEPRPSSTVELTSFGVTGYGENVAFVGAEHAGFADRVSAWLRDLTDRDALTVESALGAENARASSAFSAYERAALEAALIDLALRQSALSLADLTGRPAAELRFVASLNGGTDPLAAIAQLRASGFSGELKLDVADTWTDAVLRELGRDPSIVILDFKGRGSPELARRVAHALPLALLEDPPEGAEIAGFRVSRDASLTNAADVSAALARGEAVNLKAARMAGVLQLLFALEHAASLDDSTRPRVYFGGMFEIGVGRTQARQLAALYCPTAPNDLALNQGKLGVSRQVANSPALIDFTQPGFGC